MGEFSSDHAILRKCTVDRWGCVELHVGAEVVAAGPALPATAAVLLRLDSHPLTDSGLRHLLAYGNDAARQLMAKDQGTRDNEVADPPVPVVVSIGAADSDCSDLDEHLVARHRGGRHLLDVECLHTGEHARSHVLGNGGGSGVGCLGHCCRSLQRMV